MGGFFVEFGTDGFEEIELVVFEVELVQEREVCLPLGDCELLSEAHWLKDLMILFDKRLDNL